MTRKKPYIFVEIEWLDAHHTSEEHDVNHDVWYPATQITRGWLVRNETYENFITIANEYNKDEPNLVRGLDSIPKGMIVEVRRKRV